MKANIVSYRGTNSVTYIRNEYDVLVVFKWGKMI